MARRFGGPHSPGQNRNARPDSDRGDGPRRAEIPPGHQPGNRARRAHPFAGRRPERTAGRINILFFAAIPFVFRAFNAPPAAMVQSLGAFGILVLAAWLTRQGVIAHEAFDARAIARRPAIPRKIFGAVLTGLGLTLGGQGPETAWLPAALIGLLGLGLHLLAFGPDPLRDKRPEGADPFQTERVARALAEAEAHLAALLAQLAPLRDPALMAEAEAFAATARGLFAAVEDDPRDLSAARKHLGVYLQAARAAAAKYAALAQRGNDPAAREQIRALLGDLDQGFARQTETLRRDDRADLGVEIAVLQERLARDAFAKDLFDRDALAAGGADLQSARPGTAPGPAPSAISKGSESS